MSLILILQVQGVKTEIYPVDILGNAFILIKMKLEI